MAVKKDNVGIIVAGGPAPGINGVISAATIEAQNRRKKVIGILDGFKWIAKGKITKAMELTIDNTSRVHTQGGSIIGISRENPFSTPARTESTINSLKKLGIKYLLTIGGDGTMYLADKLEREMKGAVQVVHLPKTIDNNLPLHVNDSTFGYETAKHIGTEIVSYVMEDARTTRRWFLIVTMGRKTGHLAMGIGKSSGATLVLIPEEFKDEKLPVRKIVKILEGSIIKRLKTGRDYGVAIVAEGIAGKINSEDIKGTTAVRYDHLGRIRFSDFQLAPFLKRELEESLKNKGIDITIVEKRIGYELRSAPPIPFDLCYTRDLGYSAVKYLLSGGTRSLISIKNGKMIPLDFDTLKDKRTGAMKIRYVDIETESYEVAQRYMIKLKKDDLKNKEAVKKMASVTNMTQKAFVEYFSEVAE